MTVCENETFMKKKILKRRIEFNGFHKQNSLVIGNHGNAELVAKGSFDLSGPIFCKHSVEFKVTGDGLIRFNGSCHSLIINVKGDCILDFSKLNSKEIFCESIKGKSTILLGPTKVIRIANLEEEAVLKYTGRPLIIGYSLKGDSVFQSTYNNRPEAELLKAHPELSKNIIYHLINRAETISA